MPALLSSSHQRYCKTSPASWRNTYDGTDFIIEVLFSIKTNKRVITIVQQNSKPYFNSAFLIMQNSTTEVGMCFLNFTLCFPVSLKEFLIVCGYSFSPSDVKVWKNSFLLSQQLAIQRVVNNLGSIIPWNKLIMLVRLLSVASSWLKTQLFILYY